MSVLGELEGDQPAARNDMERQMAEAVLQELRKCGVFNVGINRIVGVVRGALDRTGLELKKRGT